MDKQALIDLATGPLARALLKLTAVVGGGTTTLTPEGATRNAAAILTVLVLVIEQWQSWYAHKRTATKAVEKVIQN